MLLTIILPKKFIFWIKGIVLIKIVAKFQFQWDWWYSSYVCVFLFTKSDYEIKTQKARYEIKSRLEQDEYTRH